MSDRMEVDRQLYESSDLLSQLVSIINNNELIFCSLKFFAQDVTTVEGYGNVFSILQSIKSKYEDSDTLYKILEFIFKEINLKTNCLCSSECITKIREFLPVTPMEGLVSPPTEAPYPHVPIYTPSAPEEPKTIDPIPSAASSRASLSDEFIFFKLANEIPIQQLDGFAVAGLKIQMVVFDNITYQKGTADKIKAVLNKWKIEAPLSDELDKMPSYTKEGLIRALTDAKLNYVVQFVKANC